MKNFFISLVKKIFFRREKAIIRDQCLHLQLTELFKPYQIDVGVASAGNESLRTVDDELGAVPLGHRAQGSRVGSGTRFGETVGSELVHAGQQRNPLGALLVVAELVDHPAAHAEK